MRTTAEEASPNAETGQCASTRRSSSAEEVVDARTKRAKREFEEIWSNLVTGKRNWMYMAFLEALVIGGMAWGGIAHDRDVGLIKLGKDDVERVLGALQNAREGNIEFDAVIPDHAAGNAGFDHALLGQIGIAPAGEQVESVPFALTVAHEHENIVCQRVCHSLVGAFSVVRWSSVYEIPSTSAIA